MVNKDVKKYFKVFGFSALTGVFAALFILCFKYCAKHVIGFSGHIYAFLKNNHWYLLIALPILLLISYLLNKIYKKFTELSGGGIATSICASKGYLKLKGTVSLVGSFILSLLTFFIGVPLGNEGPSVQIGASVGEIFGRFTKKEDEQRIVIGSGASAGFSVATGSAVSALTFAFEEADVAFKALPLISVCSSAVFAHITTKLFNLLFGVSTALLDKFVFVDYSLRHIWIAVAIGVMVGGFSVLFLKYHKIINTFINVRLSKIPKFYKIFVILLLTVVCGVLASEFISTGHTLTEELFSIKGEFLFLLVVLLVRTTLTLSANVNGLTGGMFLPLLVLGAIIGSLCGSALVEYFSINDDVYALCVVLGIACSIGGMMRMPLTAIVFTLEAMTGFTNILYIIVAVLISWAITKLFNEKSINHKIIDKFKQKRV